MSTILITQIRQEVERRVAERLPSKILDAHIQYHSRRRIRPGCECNFCVEKRKATSYVGFCDNTLELTEYGPVDDIDALFKEISRKTREKKRRLVHINLDKAKREIL
jgi:hypothetical protein